MALRVTQSTFFRRTVADIQRSYARLYAAQARVTSESRLLRVSDDPAAAARALALRGEGARLAQFRENADHARSIVDDAASRLEELSGILIQARERAVAASTGTASQLERDVIAEEIDQFLAQAIAIANARSGDRYLFGGARSTSAPFESASGNGGTRSVAYRGAGEGQEIGVLPGLSIGVDVPGSRIFLPSERGATLFESETGAAAGAGTSNGVGSATLTVRHGVTTLGDAAGPGGGDTLSGLGLGASSAALDTVIGSHTIALTVDGSGSFGTVSLDGGPAVAFTTSDTNFALADATGKSVVHLDLSSVTAGFTGSVSVAASGSLTADGGATLVPIDFTANQAVTDSVSGRITYVDTTAVARAGDVHVTYSGTAGLFDTLIGLRDELRNARGATTASQIAAVERGIEDLDRVHQSVLESLSNLGARSARLELVQSRLDELRVGTEERLEEVAGIDLPTAISELQQQQSALEIALQLGARLEQPTLLDFLS